MGLQACGQLTAEVLGDIMEPYRGTDIDSGGTCDLLDKEGRGVEEVVILTLGMDLAPRPVEPRDMGPQWEAYDAAVQEAFSTLVKRFGWDE